jgi:hypothetical protein
MEDPNLGWEDPIAQANSLQIAVNHLCAHGLKWGQRLERATSPLVKYRRWPERLKGRLKNVINAWEAVPKEYQYQAEGAPTVRQLNFFTPRECRALVDDILALYEACLLDIGRMQEMGGLAAKWYNVMYPKDVAPRTVKPLKDNAPRNLSVYQPRGLRHLWSDP